MEVIQNVVNVLLLKLRNDLRLTILFHFWVAKSLVPSFSLKNVFLAILVKYSAKPNVTVF